jgi:L-ascorbate metabolism protein UlaG (beta-lactamase superfamily)
MLKLTYYSHSAFGLDDGKTSLIIDPFLTGNPAAPVKAKDVKVDYVILTHAHGDHLGDGLEIAARNGATIIAVNELANYCIDKGAKAHNMHIGGGYNFPFGWVKFTIAHHGSVAPDGAYAGNPAGVVVTMGGKAIYHSGDTGLFYDMKLIGEMNPLDVALLPIGDNFTMGIDDAAKAVELLNPKLAIPMHYNTWPVIAADPMEFVSKVEKKGYKARVMKAGETIEL